MPEIKARNIYRSLPRALQKFHFRLIPVSNSKQTEQIKQEQILKTAAAHAEKMGRTPVNPIVYKTVEFPSDMTPEMNNWMDKIESFNGIRSEAKIRKEVLVSELNEVEKMKVDIEHEIELVEHLNACEGYKKYRDLRAVLKKRRCIKDELLVVQIIIDANFNSEAVQQVKRQISGITKRKYTYRVGEPL